MLSTRRHAGFTLIELVVMLAILAITAAFASNSWGRFIERSTQRTVINDLHTVFAYARWSAASRRSLITVCPLSTNNTCVDDWNRPISVFVDENRDKQPDQSPLRTFAPELGAFKLHSRTAGRGYFRFDERGMISGSMGSLVLCPANFMHSTMSYMPINIVGRFRVEQDDDGDGMISLSWGGKVTCP
ncbi:GspH/FimT family pseudopilin [Marinobacter sp. C2H3]|uniref:GspH/FimT family pseudopilin n=1 Tax=Marinobacter sp. C2H3 TaxID=3119003 RepID=UPI00300ED0B3